MDYDENDFQGQKLPLAGEGCSKVPPLLRPYAIPKFDFDDSLQGHLRFDSSVQNEIFLGITNQEDNRWIEEYSCGSSGMDFSSSAAESRRNNVWSEATSSESVEMLLKSVGQEERVVEETIIQQTKSCDGPESSTKIMYPNLNQDDGKDHVTVTQNSSVLHEFSEQFTGFSVNSEFEQSQVRFTSQSQVAQLSSGELDSIITSEKRSLSVFEVKEDGKCDDVDQKEAENLTSTSMDEELPEELSVSKLEFGNPGYSKNVDANIEEPKVQENLQQSGSGFSKSLSDSVAELDTKHKESGIDNPTESGTMIVESYTYSMERSLCVDSNVEFADKVSVGITVPVNEGLTSLLPTKSSDLQIAEECNYPLCSVESSQGTVTASLMRPEVSRELKDGIQHESLAVLPNSANFVLQAVQVDNTKSQIPDSSESDLGSLSKISQMQNCSIEESDKVLGNDNQQVTSDTYMAPAGNLPEMGDGSSIDQLGTNLTAACSSAEVLAENVSNEDVKTGNDAPKVHARGSNDEDRSSDAKLSGLVQVDSEIKSSDPSAMCMDQDVSFAERRDISFPVECSDMNVEVVGSLDSQKNIESSVSAEGSKGNIVITQNSESGTSVQAEPVAATESDISPSPDALDGVNVPSESVAKADIITDDQPKSPILGLTSLQHDNKDEVQSGLSSEQSAQNETPPVASVVDYVSDGPPSLVEKEVSPDHAEKVQHAGHGAPPIENCDVSPSEQAAEANAGGLECCKTSEVNPSPCDPSVKRGDNALSDAAMELDKRDSVAMELDKSSSPDPQDGVNILSGSVTPADIVIDPQPQSPIHGVSSLHQDHEEKAQVGSPSGESSHNETPQVESVIDCVSEGPSSIDEQNASLDCAGKLVPSGGFSSPVRNCNKSGSEQAPEANTVGQECLNTLQMSPRSCDSSVKRGDNAEARGLLAPKESSTEHKHTGVPLAVNMSNEHQASVDVVPLSEHDAFSGKPQFVSPAGTSSVDLSESANDKKEVSKTVDTVEGNIQPVTEISATEEEKNFNFEIRTSASPGQADKGHRSYSTFQACNLSRIVEGQAMNSSGSQEDAKKLHEISLASSGATSQGGAKGNSERKTRKKSVGKESAKKGNPPKETTPIRHSGRVENPTMSLTTSASGEAVRFEEVKLNENAERGVTKPSGVLPVFSSKLPDLNNSTSMFQQPFTDNQQVQLRAQILLYGSLISGTPPEESHMVAAFGQSDCEMRVWEGAWRSCVERLHAQKTKANPDTPMQPRSDQGIKHISLQSKVLSSPIGGASNKGTPLPILSPMIPLSSPLWNVSTPSGGLQSSDTPRSSLLDYHQALSPLHPYQTPTVQSFRGHASSWLSQGPFSGQWVTSSPIPAYNVGARLSITEAVKLTPVKESGSPGIKNTSSIPMAYSVGPSGFHGVSSISDAKNTTLGDSKSRKRKKVNASVALKEISVPSLSQIVSVSGPVPMHLPQGPQMSLLTQNQIDSVRATVVSSPFSASVALTKPAFLTSKTSPAKVLSVASPSTRSGDQNVEKVMLSEDSLSKVGEAKMQAEDAAARAAAAVGHCQDVWTQLERQKKASLISDDEAKLVSAAVSIAAAASVAKVAAAAAKIASNVAEEARLMADEVFLSHRSETNATPGSNHPNSVISAAREAARRRLEAASAASKHAENLDAIVKAAELASEAVSQTGQIVGMGEPLALSDLVKAGPQGYWKTPRFVSKQTAVVTGSSNGDSNKKNVESTPNMSARETQAVKPGLSVQENSGFSLDNDTRRHKARKSHDLPKTIGVIPESEISASVGPNMPKNTSGILKENIIKEGCLVEVYKDDDKYKGAWFGANVLSLKDGKAFVCYTELQSDEGQLTEWVSLEVEGSEAPKIRIAHPVTTMRFEGTRKRRRTAVTDFTWSIGDKVDVWMQNCWREGVVTETNKVDPTSLTVCFPGQGETLVVRSWYVRPTLMWKDGVWTKCRMAEEGRSSQGDAQQKKRQKLGSPAADSSKNVTVVEPAKTDESRKLPLSAQESLFNVGKSTNLDPKRTMRSGLQKEGPRVIFGVPKPGKKQKFMDVSKHYVGDGSGKNKPAHETVKFTRYLMPQAPGTGRWRNNARIDAKEKQPSETKSRVLKSRKPPIPATRTFTPSKTTGFDDENRSGRQNQMEFGSSSIAEETTGGSELASSHAPPPKNERPNKRKFAPAGRKATKVEKEEPVEPRRSNRRIQPTSRLLEGLQSSLTISKMPAASHSSQRSHGKTTSKGNHHHD